MQLSEVMILNKILSSAGAVQEPNTDEDADLFPSGVVKVRMALSPRAGENRRGDWVVAGVLSDGTEVQVVFAGRRSKATQALRRELAMMWRKAITEARAKNTPAPDASKVLLPIMLEGGWRALFRRGEDGWETRKYQLMAARWTYVLSDESVEVAGEPVRNTQDVEMSVVAGPQFACA